MRHTLEFHTAYDEYYSIIYKYIFDTKNAICIFIVSYRYCLRLETPADCDLWYKNRTFTFQIKYKTNILFKYCIKNFINIYYSILKYRKTCPTALLLFLSLSLARLGAPIESQTTNIYCYLKKVFGIESDNLLCLSITRVTYSIANAPVPIY